MNAKGLGRRCRHRKFLAAIISLNKVFSSCRKKAMLFHFYFFFALLCASSLAWPCGPSGRDSTLILTYDTHSGCCDPKEALNPRSFNSFATALAANKLGSPNPHATVIPVMGGKAGASGPLAAPVNNDTGAWAGEKANHCAACSAVAMSRAKLYASGSPSLYTSVTFSPENLARVETIFDACVGSNRRHATAASILSRAFCSSSAWVRAVPASFLAVEAAREAASAEPLARSEASAAASAEPFAASAFVSAVVETSNADWALLSAVLAFWSSEPIICSESVSFLCPYGYATASQSTAMPKHQSPIPPNVRSPFSFFDLCARTSKNASNTKKIIAANSKSLWTRLTESSEFQSGKKFAVAISSKEMEKRR